MEWRVHKRTWTRCRGNNFQDRGVRFPSSRRWLEFLKHAHSERSIGDRQMRTPDKRVLSDNRLQEAIWLQPLLLELPSTTLLFMHLELLLCPRSSCLGWSTAWLCLPKLWTQLSDCVNSLSRTRLFQPKTTLGSKNWYSWWFSSWGWGIKKHWKKPKNRENVSRR